MTQKKINRDELALTPEEKQLEQDFDNGQYQPIPSMEEKMVHMQKIAEKSIKKKTTTATSIRRENELLEKVKEAAAKEHIPYQTYIKSIVFKHIDAVQGI